MVVGGVVLAVGLFATTLAFVAAGWGRCADQWRQASAAGDQACRALLQSNDIGGASEALGFSLMGLLFVGLGAVLAVRRRDNSLGWIFLGSGLLFVLNPFTTVYSAHGAEAPGSLPAATFVLLLVEVLGGPVIFAPFVLFFLLFPNGRVLSPRWRWVVAALGASVLVQSLDLALHAPPLRFDPLHDNPIGLSWLTNDVRPWIQTPAVLVMLGCLVASVVSLVLRFRRSRGIERQQMKWFTTSSAGVGVTFAVAPIFWNTPSIEPLWGPMFMLATVSVPVAATVAILRYRLYDLDVLVNRALVYGLLTGLLGAVYLGSVFALQRVLSRLGGSSDLAVAGSTLAVAALFGPARSRVQRFIDQRFFRRRYDAGRTVATFSSRLRHETDIGALRSDLLGAVEETVRPTSAVLWLRDSAAAQ